MMRAREASAPWSLAFEPGSDDDAPLVRVAGPEPMPEPTTGVKGKGKGKGKGKVKGKGKAKNPKASSAADAKRVKKDIQKPNEEGDDEASERWRFTAARFIWQKHYPFDVILGKFADKTIEYSIAHERGTHDHTDLYVVFDKKQDWATLDQVAIEDEDGVSKPFVFPNTARGAQFR